MSRFPPLYLASGNLHKVAELQGLADNAGLPLCVHSAREVGGMPEVVEDTGTFIGNARKKAIACRAQVPEGGWVMADDSGICVDALGGGPGVESAYFAGPDADDAANLAKLVELMRGRPATERSAHYVCVLLLLDEQGAEHVFEGFCHGVLDAEPRGTGGFGYDPLFKPAGHTATFGELPAATKQALSHRAAAWSKFAHWVQA
jgi:XTP/dITP diphosphohydrolase